MDFKKTVFLPRTDFPMKASLSQREPELLSYWQGIDLYASLRRQSKGRPKFMLHDGPPYANGHIHSGHALNKILKDIVVKTYQMLGYDAPFVPGWDCHGLPIEWKIEEGYRAKGLNKDTVPLLQFRQECRQFAAHWIDVQRSEFKRLGVLGEWENPYTTMDFKMEAHIAEQLGKFLLNGSLYQGLKPVMWSVVEKTALAEAEVEYKDHTSDSIYVGFPVYHPALPVLKGVEVLIWTTTPWTLPGNRAIAYGKSFDYAILHLPTFQKRVLVAKELVLDIVKRLQVSDYSVEAMLEGESLKGTICEHPFKGKGYDFDVPLLPADHVTLDAGTGLVHTAPGHGADDFRLGQAFNLEIPQTVGPDGYFYDTVPHFAGEHVYKVNPKVIALLESTGHLLHAGHIIHSYPHSWRSKTPLIFRATTQWFISMDTHRLRDKALSEVDKIQWFPSQTQNRIRAMIENRPDWCLSRQRAWGTPITVFINKKTGQVLRDPEVHERIVAAIREEGADTWYTSPPSRFLGTQYNADDYEQVMDILDVWFDSGCTHDFVLKTYSNLEWPADLYLEASDQHRGWFQVSLLEACGTVGKSPYRQVLTHGHVLDEKGYKMSKSLGNVIAPEAIVNKQGADILRLWVASTDVMDDMRIGAEVMKQPEELYRRFRNTLRYLLGALDGFSHDEKVSFEEMPLLEQWVLGRLAELDDRLRAKSIPRYDFLDFYNELHTFCAVDLSAFYFDIRKDCLYCDAYDSIKRRATRTTIDLALNCLIRWLAPVLCFTAEEAYFAYRKEMKGSIHLEMFPNIPTDWQRPDLMNTMEVLRDVRRVMTGALEIERAAKTIGSSLQATLTIYVSKKTADLLKDYDLAEIGITSAAQVLIAQPPAGAFVLEDVHNVGVVVNIAEGRKCTRCWKVLEDVGQGTHADLCIRCDEVVKSLPDV